MNGVERGRALVDPVARPPDDRLVHAREPGVTGRTPRLNMADLALERAQNVFYSTRRRLAELSEIPNLSLDLRREQAELRVREAWFRSRLPLSPEDSLKPPARTELLRSFLREPVIGDYLGEEITLHSGEKKTRMAVLREDVEHLLRHTRY